MFGSLYFSKFQTFIHISIQELPASVLKMVLKQTQTSIVQTTFVLSLDEQNSLSI